MLDHVGITTAALAKAKTFYAAALAPLGYTVLMDVGPAFGMGVDGKPDFWLSEGKNPGGVHVAIAARNRKAVDAFYAAAIAAGGKDNGAPGLRPHYHASYYGAFVLDADGNNIEAVCHTPE
jgi:catechol 2,3-dioxygenase-like lactoylglutathione lyase family enzyme